MDSKELKIFGEKLEISDFRITYCVFYNVIVERSASEMRSFYYSDCSNIEDVLNKTSEKMNMIRAREIDRINKRFVAREIYDYDADTISQQVFSNSKFDIWLSNLKNIYNKIKNGNGNTDTADFAIDTIASAATDVQINSALSEFGESGGLSVGTIASGAMLGLSLISDAMDAAEAKKKIKEMYFDKKYVNALYDAVSADMVKLLIFFNDVLSKHIGANILSPVPSEDIDRSASIFNNIKKGAIPSEKLRSAWLEAFTLNPLNDELYRYALLNFEENIPELQVISEALNHDLNENKEQIISSAFDVLAVKNYDDACMMRDKVQSYMQKLGLDKSETYNSVKKLADDYEAIAKTYFSFPILFRSNFQRVINLLGEYPKHLSLYFLVIE